MEKTRKLVLFGDSAYAEIAREYFDHDSPYAVIVLDLTPEGDRVSNLFVVTNPDKLTHVQKEEA